MFPFDNGAWKVSLPFKLKDNDWVLFNLRERVPELNPDSCVKTKKLADPSISKFFNGTSAILILLSIVSLDITLNWILNFVSPAIHKEEHVTISVGTNGRNAMQSVDIRNQITKLFQDGTIHL